MDERPALQLPDITPRAIAAADEITFIGTATTLIKVAGFSILTGPNFLPRGDRAYVGMGLSAKRLTEPALSIQQLPELDFIVLSHHHGDHFHLGGTRIAGILLTMDAQQGVEALRIIAPREAIPIHYEDYTVFKSPLPEFRQAAAHARLGAKLHYLDRGASYRLSLGVPGS